jgi:hypothetical protein
LPFQFSGAREFLDSLVASIGRVELARARAEGDVADAAEGAFAKRDRFLAEAREPHKATVDAVGHPGGSGRVDGQAERRVGLARALFAEDPNRRAVESELLDPVVSGVAHIQRAVGVGDAFGPAQRPFLLARDPHLTDLSLLTDLGPWLGLAFAELHAHTERLHEFAGGGELVDAVVRRVRHPHVAVAVERQRPRVADFACSGASFAEWSDVRRHAA